jgi:transcriptional regulator with XRE-family HTH domain
MIQYYLPFQHLQQLSQHSERRLAEVARLSRGAVRQLLYPSRRGNLTINSIEHLAQVFDRDVEVVIGGVDIFSEYSTLATAFKIERDGCDSWKTHLFDFVDEFRRTADGRLVILPPPSRCDKRTTALLASTVRTLCEELAISTPRWATRRHFISHPWFVSGMNSLKASALVESPLHFRANNIFVHSNFLSRV